MKLRKITSILSAGLLIGSVLLSGCSNGGGGGTSKEAESEKATSSSVETASSSAETDDAAGQEEEGSADKIVVFQSKVEIIDQLEALAKDYEEETGVEVEVWGTTGDDYFQQLRTKLSNNQGPTVFSLGTGSEATQMSAYLADLSDLSFVDKIMDGMATESDGKIVGVPYTAEGFGLVYNKDLYDPEQIKTTDDLIDYMKEQKDAGGNGLMLSQESYFLIGHILNTPFALQDDPADFMEKLEAGEVKMADTPEFQEFAKLYAAIREYCVNPLEQNYDKEIGDFATGKTATIHQGNWAAGMFADYDMDFEMGLAPLPIAGNDKLAVSVPSAWFVNSQASEEEQKAGKKFIEWLYTSDTGVDYLMNQFGFIPVVEGMESEKADVLSQDVSKYAEEGKTIGWPNSDWPAGIVDVYLVPIAQEFFTTDMTPEDFLLKLDEAWVTAAKQ